MAEMTGHLPVLWICGAPGVGKSTIAWGVVESIREEGAPVAHVDIDQLGICYPERPADPDRHLLKARSLAALVENFASAGATRLVISGVIEEEHVHKYTELIDAGSITWALLRLDHASLRKRLLARGWSPAFVDATIRYARAAEASHFASFTLDTTGKDVEEVVSVVRDRLIEEPMSASAPYWTPPTAPTAGTGASRLPVVWVCGPTAVGKSAVGWQVFQRALTSGLPAAYVDLAQLGQLRPATATDPRNHWLKARNLAAVLAIYRGGGARCAVVTGAVDGPELLSTYHELLPNVALTLCRLTGSDQTLGRVIRDKQNSAISEELGRRRAATQAALKELGTDWLRTYLPAWSE